jgi:predicted nucleotidyltransferase
MKLSSEERAILRLLIMRSLMEAYTDKEDFWLWHKESLDRAYSESKKQNIKPPKTFENKSIQKRKLQFTKNLVNNHIPKIFLKFIGVSGSIAARNVKEEDDIDLFIVVSNYTSWIYRLIFYLRMNRYLRKPYDVKVKDKLCDNFIIEERALEMENKDIFTLHELLYLVPTYNKDYYYKILQNNKWIEKYGCNLEHISTSQNTFLRENQNGLIEKLKRIFAPLNLLCFLGQVGYMLIKKHRPNTTRLWRGFKEGYIKFYPPGFREKILNRVEEAMPI